MKILFLAHRIPYPPDKGDKIRSFHELRALSEWGHEIHLFAFADDLRDLQCQVDLSRYCAAVRVLPLRRAAAGLRAAASLASSRPLSIGYYASRKMRRMIDRAVRETDFDAVLVYSSTMLQYASRALSDRTIVDLVDIDSEKWREYAVRATGFRSRLLALESERLRRYELEAVRSAAYTIVSSGREAGLLEELDEFTRHARLRVMTNGVDTEYFQPTDSRIEGRPGLVFTGAMDYRPNIDGVRWFVDRVWPLVRDRMREVEFVIAGRNPSREVRHLARNPGISVTGEVDDMRPYWRRATVSVAPLTYARGVQNKVLEAMAMGTPVVATPASVGGLSVEDGRHLLVAESPEEFASAVNRLLEEQDLRRSLAGAARGFVEHEHRWPAVLQPLLDLIESFDDQDLSDEARYPAHGLRFPI
ncbi:MAG: TIGR03087 family PEP-CTERM/XrtA system glycosyltransferase [Acidobacteriota bacterium]|nr:MAG: TIGR03087 family PEP-CTERM/XrtA system glycosyltransferase [Acidobacteriota bacterium]